MSLSVRSFVYALLVLSVMVSAGKPHHNNKNNLYDQIGKDNWEQLLDGEWMIKFYLRECVTCGFVEPVWEDLAHQKKELGIKVGKMPITDAPDLNFLDRQSVTYKIVPALYHVKNGVFRQYKGQIHQDLLTKFILKKIWKNIAPIDLSNENLTDFSRIENPRISDQKSIHHDKKDDIGNSQQIFLIVTVVSLLMIYLSLLIVIVIRNRPKTNKKDDKTDVEDCIIPDNYMGYERLVNFIGNDTASEKTIESKDNLNNNVVSRDSILPRYTIINDSKTLANNKKGCDLPDSTYFKNFTQPSENQTQQLKKILFPEKCLDSDEKNLVDHHVVAAPGYANVDSAPQRPLSSNAFYKAVHKLAADFNRIENPRVSAKKAAKIDYLVHYTRITGSQQKRQYKREFYAHYAEYLKMHHRAIRASQQFRMLRKRMKRLFGRGDIVEYEETRRRFLEKYFESRDVHERYYYLHNKLRYIKKLVAEYEAECGGGRKRSEREIVTTEL